MRKYPNAINEIVRLTDCVEDEQRLQNGCLAIWCLCLNNGLTFSLVSSPSRLLLLTLRAVWRSGNNATSFKDAGVAALLHKVLETCEEYPENDTLKTNVLGAIAVVCSRNGLSFLLLLLLHRFFSSLTARAQPRSETLSKATTQKRSCKRRLFLQTTVLP